ncbi:ATP-binding protein [Cellulosimicrobium arenosum]|uniref:AAA family ATPase n=1 Tax=Cellulosimicrobium arenosum TaxID=2708133 RepID=A0A927G624_9MICO|nr:LuxR family transcriptional regulator [Cellulosimicrobium arenosum]MBD8077639.1 AAA family ATPase [Cellulosimicrobium arenosum]
MERPWKDAREHLDADVDAQRVSGPPAGRSAGSLLGRDRELTRLLTLVDRAREGGSGALVVSGGAGVGKTALLDRVVDLAGSGVRVERMVASESEMELPYAGLQLLCGHLMSEVDHLPGPQREALETAFGLRGASALNPLVVGLGVRGLLTRAAADRALLCVVDDAQWLDDVSARAVASVARRLGSEGIAVVVSMRTVDEQFADLPQLALQGLGYADAREVLRLGLPGVLDRRVRDQLITESGGNPLALRELPGTLSPAELAGGFALASSLPLESRIELSLLARLESLPASTRTLLLLAAADPTGDTGLLWRAGAVLGLDPEDLDAAQQADALVVGARVTFRHPLIRSAVYRAATPEDRRSVHAALADVTYADRDPDRRAWHRAAATLRPEEGVARDLEQSAGRARARGGVAAAAAFLERSAELSPEPGSRADRLIAAAGAKHDAGAPDTALRLLDSARDLPLTPLQEALVGRLRARAGYALRRDRSAPLQLLRAAQALEPHDRALARDTYMEALSAAVYAGRLGEPGAVEQVADAILAATADDRSERAQDLILRGQALLSTRGQESALPIVRRAVRAFLGHPPDALELHWMWFGGRAAQDIWDAEALRTLAERQVRLARAGGVLTVLPMALSLLMVARTFDGHLDEAEAICDDIDTILSVTGQPLPQYGRVFVAAYRGQVEEVERGAARLRADAYARGEGYALTVANLAEALVYNGAGRYREALVAAREELPYSHELGHAMRTLLEVVEAAARTGERAVAEEAFERLVSVTEPVGDSEWARAFVALAEAQLRDGDEAESLYREAIDGFDRVRVPMLKGRAQLVYGEMLRRQNRRVDARVQLRAAYAVLSSCGMEGFADRAARELRATGETVHARSSDRSDDLTDQEGNVARLARDGLTNREIGARLFLSAHTVEWHLRKVFVKLGIRSRTELRTALPEAD